MSTQKNTREAAKRGVAGISQGTLNTLGGDYRDVNRGVRLRVGKISKTLSTKGFEGVRLYEES